MKSLLVFALTFLAFASVQAGITTREVSYPAGNVTAKGLLCLPEGKGRHPGVIVVHEFWGRNDYAVKRAKMLVGLGYVALAADMYGDGKVGAHPADAMAMMQVVNNNLPEARRRFAGALSFLQSQPEVDPDKIAAIGYCFGGGIVLQMAADNLPGLDAVASFHGSLAESPSGKTVTAKILVCHGAEDAFTTPEILQNFQQSFQAAGADVTFISYPGAKHGFTNPDATRLGQEFKLPIAYDADADAKSWAELQKFLKTAFATPPRS